MYAQKLEGDEWIGERMDTGKIDKMSGMSLPANIQTCVYLLSFNGSAVANASL